MKYFEHLWGNWRVAGHAATDVFAHFVHGLLPFIKIQHHQPVDDVIVHNKPKSKNESEEV